MNQKLTMHYVQHLALGLCFVSWVQAADWPQWRGPERNGISRETGLLQQWPKEGPPLVWKKSDIGSGYSTPAVVGPHLYLLANEGVDNEYVQAHSVKDGQRVWRTALGRVGPNPAQMDFAGARSTPTVDGGSLYVLGSDGDLASLQLNTGQIRWKKNLRQEFGGKPGDWAYSESPLVDGEKVVCTPGGSEATLVALDKNTGNVIWKCAAPEGDTAAFSSAVITEVGGIRQYVQLLQKGLVGVEARTGKLLWRYERPVSRFNANIPTPLASGSEIYVASAGTGGGTIRLKGAGNGITVEPLYFEAKLPTAIGGVIKLGDSLYGTTGQAMLCVEFATGKVRWEERGLGAASLCYADNRLYVHGENGDVALVEPSSEAYREKGRFTPSDQPEHAKPMEKAWAYPVVAGGRLYIRDQGSLWSYDVRAR